ncbi:SDR family oxidoreductase [Sorangium sp. So ce1151]|uniref:SDR family oxidoreductase n=1 Tax=Sorangium sp. So ce1151 TaxID=3133332 RepID=UPI003F633C1D
MILVTGGIENVGGAVLEQLIDAGAPLRALERDPARLGELGGKVAVVKGDLSKPETLDAAFAGADSVFSTVEQLLGRRARTFYEWLERHVKVFQ